MSIWRNSFINVIRLKDKYILLAIISFIGSALMLAAFITINSTSKLNKMLTLPYECYYQAVPLNKAQHTSGDIVYLNAWGASAEQFLKAHTVVDTVYVTKTYEKELKISPVNTQNEISAKEYGDFPVFVIPSSAYDSSFRKGERVLVSGRHITPADSETYALLLDEKLADGNGLAVGDSVIMSGVNGDVEYSIAGIFRTVKIQREVSLQQDVLCNAVIASGVPDESGQRPSQMYDLFVKFSHDIDIKGFFEYMDRFPGVYSPTYAGFQFVSVKELNASYNQGVNTLFSVSIVMLVVLVVTVACATVAFCKVLVSHRRREILIMRALNAPSSRVMQQFLAETVYVHAPFSVIGAVTSVFAFRKIIGELLVLFSSAVTPENLSNTSSFHIEYINNIRLSTVEYLPLGTLLSFIAAVFFIMLFITVSCVVLQMTAFNREKMMVLLQEGRR